MMDLRLEGWKFCGYDEIDLLLFLFFFSNTSNLENMFLTRSICKKLNVLGFFRN